MVDDYDIDRLHVRHLKIIIRITDSDQPTANNCTMNTVQSEFIFCHAKNAVLKLNDKLPPKYDDKKSIEMYAVCELNPNILLFTTNPEH